MDISAVDVCPICRASAVVSSEDYGTTDSPCWHMADEATPTFGFVAPLLVEYLTRVSSEVAT